jgi:hypothetical protein
VFEVLRVRREAGREKRRELALQRMYDTGFDARMRGVPCMPPEECYVEMAIDLVGSWTAGWEAADRERSGGRRGRV